MIRVPLALLALVGCASTDDGPVYSTEDPLYQPDGNRLESADDGSDGQDDGGSGSSALAPDVGDAVGGELVITTSYGTEYGTWDISGEVVACSDCAWAFEATFSGPSVTDLSLIFRESGGALRAYLNYYGYERYWGEAEASAGVTTWTHNSAAYYDDYGYYGYIYEGRAEF